MGKVSFISGIVMIGLSAVLFTTERFIAVLLYVSDSFPVKLNGNGSYPGEPNMPAIFDNFFVGLLLILGLLLIVLGVIQNNRLSK
ncbi:hypothetical protein [Ornithinibacillus sp. JPR2-1]|uniref:hypothetical protein n=1 Tax=Ornithinibacillus sp. JPR2-1 TaxID=2094019 RepID=UPI0031DD52CC